MSFPSAMAEALRLTRAGRLDEAAALLRTGLPGMTVPAGGVSGAPLDLKPARVTLAPVPEHATEARAAGARPADGRTEERRFVGAQGTLAYQLYRPANATAGMPLVVMLHGCTQSPEDFAAGTGMNRLADEHGFLVAYPRQTQAANAQKCWNWFKPGDQARDRGEPALLAGMTREVVAAERADGGRMYVAGLSAGGAAAAIMAAAYPDLFAAVGIHSGLGCGAARDLPSALSAMRSGGGSGARTANSRFVPLITFHGDRDGTVNEINSREIVAAAATAAGGGLTSHTETGQSSGGRGFTRTVSKDAADLAVIEQWTIHGLRHAWSGGSAAGSYTDPSGPDASREMIRFFLEHRLGAEEV